MTTPNWRRGDNSRLPTKKASLEPHFLTKEDLPCALSVVQCGLAQLIPRTISTGHEHTGNELLLEMSFYLILYSIYLRFG